MRSTVKNQQSESCSGTSLLKVCNLLMCMFNQSPYGQGKFHVQLLHCDLRIKCVTKVGQCDAGVICDESWSVTMEQCVTVKLVSDNGVGCDCEDGQRDTGVECDCEDGQCDTGVVCDSEVGQCDTGVVSDSEVGECDTGVVCDSEVDQCDTGVVCDSEVGQCDTGVGCD